MLRRFSVRGFRGFREEAVLDLTKVRNYSFHTECVSDGVLSRCVLIGPNGCGKTDMGLALLDLRRRFDGGPCPVDPGCRLNIGSGTGCMEFRCEISDGDSVIVYGYRRDGDDDVYDELLSVDGEVVHDPGDGPCPDDAEGMGAVRRFAEGIVVLGGDAECPNDVTSDEAESLRRYILDMTGTDIDVLAEDGVLLIRSENSEVPFASVASAGMMRLAELNRVRMRSERASLVFLDDFDTHLHHTAVERVMRGFISSAARQVVFTTHSTPLVSNRVMRPDCYLLMDGDSAVPLPELTDRELREGHNLEKLLRGREFGIPGMNDGNDPDPLTEEELRDVEISLGEIERDEFTEIPADASEDDVRRALRSLRS